MARPLWFLSLSLSLTHTHTCARAQTLALRILLLLQTPSEGFLWSPPVSVQSIRFVSSVVAKRVPSRPVFRVENSQKSLGETPGECGGCMITKCSSRHGTVGQQTMCGSVRYREAETVDPTACSTASCDEHRLAWRGMGTNTIG
jgi:hypothetical protein